LIIKHVDAILIAEAARSAPEHFFTGSSIPGA